MTCKEGRNMTSRHGDSASAVLYFCSLAYSQPTPIGIAMLRVLLCLLFGLLLGFTLPAQAEKRVALVIGNGAYTNSPALSNPANDAAAVTASLKALEFDVTQVIDGNHRQMLDAMSAFGRAASGADVALVFYAGHGVQVSGRNWLLPVAATIGAETDLPAQAIRISDMMEVMETSGAALKLMILDACRNNPLPKAASRGASRGLARLEANTAGTMITFATAPGKTAADGLGKNSPFTAALVQHITTPGLEIRQLMGRVRETVYKSTGKQQLPWVNEALIGEFYFAGKDPNAVPVPVAPPKVVAVAKPQPQRSGLSEKEAFGLAQSLNTTGGWDAFLQQFPSGAYAAFATAARDKLTAPQPQNQTQQLAVVTPQATPAPASSGFLFPNSHRQRISPDQLNGLSKRQLRIARNEIFARRGRHFKSADLRRHFKQFSWYRPRTWNPRLNRVEKANVRLIKNTEKWR